MGQSWENGVADVRTYVRKDGQRQLAGPSGRTLRYILSNYVTFPRIHLIAFKYFLLYTNLADSTNYESALNKMLMFYLEIICNLGLALGSSPSLR